jgi:hypothetical protein
MNIFALEKHLIWSRQEANGVRELHYYDGYTLIVGALVLAWLIWILVRRYKRLRALRRPPRRRVRKLVDQVVKLKRELSSNYLSAGAANNVHAVGVGMLGGEYCIQVFVKDADEELVTASGTARVPDSIGGVPVNLIEMPAAAFNSETDLTPVETPVQYNDGIRELQEVIVGGISGANANLAGASGTIGYFCTRKSKLRRRKEIHMLSNSHVFADLRKAKVDDGDVIMQPSPGEPSTNRPIGKLVNFSELKFEGDITNPNHIDAAIARLWGTHKHRPLIPMIGAVKGCVTKKDVEVGEAVRKFGRTTGYTEGSIFSIYLDIWIRYDRTGQSAFFEDQILIEPDLSRFSRFVAKGDSGSLLVDADQYAVGLIFAGVSEVPESSMSAVKSNTNASVESGNIKPKRIENFGVANPISEVLDRLKIDLLV